MRKIKVITDFPSAVNSPDYIKPLGAKQDNHSNENYLKEIDGLTGNRPYAYMDLGCAGGKAVIDIYNKGNIACGLEGSDLTKMISNSSNGVADSWIAYMDVCLFKADITKPFTVVDEDGELQLFDIITAWDVLEHPKPNDVPNVIDNIIKHLKLDGVFVALVNTVRGSHHQCVRPKDWWLRVFRESGLIDVGFSMDTSPRHLTDPIQENDFGFMFKFEG